MGITDIDDKIINRAKSDGLAGVMGALSVSSQYEKLFLKDMRELGVLPPDGYTRVTEFVGDIIQFIKDLEVCASCVCLRGVCFVPEVVCERTENASGAIF